MTSETDSAFAGLARARESGARVADEPAGKALLAAAGVAVPESRLAGSAEEAAAAASEVGWPVAVKVVAPDLPHKTDAGGVAGPLHSAEEARAAAARILRRGAGVLLVERWEDDGVACFVGLRIGDPFGATVSFGLGGIWVELLRDIAHRMAPVDDDEALRMVRSIRAVSLLDGGRGHPPVALPALASAIAAISRLVLDPEARRLIAELDVNPLLARFRGPPLALDATVVLRDPPLSPPT